MFGRIVRILYTFGARVWRALPVTHWPSHLKARTANFASVIAAIISVIGALGTAWSARFAGHQALSARVSARAAEEAIPYARASAKAAVETLRRSDEDLRILADVDRAAPITVSLIASGDYLSFSIQFRANAAIINTGGTSAIVMDSVVETHAGTQEHQSRVDIFDASSGLPWPKLAVVRPNEPLPLNLLGTLSGDNLQFPTTTKVLTALLGPREHQGGTLQHQFDSLEALSHEVRSHAGEEAASEFDNFLYGPAAKPGPISSGPWSETGEVGHSRILLKVSTASRRTYRSSPGLLFVGPDPAYSVLEAFRQ